MNHKEKYWHGVTNKIIRYYFYSQRGLALFNEFRYLFMLIFGAYIIFKLNNPLWLGVMFITSLPLLILIGYVSVHYISKVVDWLNIEFATYWSRYSFNLQERIADTLEEINIKLSKEEKK